MEAKEVEDSNKMKTSSDGKVQMASLLNGDNKCGVGDELRNQDNNCTVAKLAKY